MMARELLQVEGLTKHFGGGRGGVFRRHSHVTQAVNDVSFDLAKGETLGVVGETGSGKSTIGRMILGLERPTAGRIRYLGEDIFQKSPLEWQALRREIQMIFQDPYASLSPRMTVARIIQEPWLVQGGPVVRERWQERTIELLAQVGLSPDAMKRYPHQFSGGQRQRIGLARALALEPKLIVCDEPVSALDVSIQAQVINLLTRLQRDIGVSYIFIAHDLSVVRRIAHRVAVMYLGRIVEIGDTQEVFSNPTHPYTQALLSAIPSVRDSLERATDERIVLGGELPSPTSPPPGCNFSTRCWRVDARCRSERPRLAKRGFGHPSACHYPGPEDDFADCSPDSLTESSGPMASEGEGRL